MNELASQIISNILEEKEEENSINTNNIINISQNDEDLSEIREIMEDELTPENSDNNNNLSFQDNSIYIDSKIIFIIYYRPTKYEF